MPPSGETFPQDTVPYCRRASVNTGLSIAGIFFPPCLWLVCLNCLTGEIYENRRNERGDRRTWHTWRKAIALLIGLGQGAALLFLLLD